MFLLTGASGYVGRHLMHAVSCMSSAPWDLLSILPVSRTGILNRGACLDLTDANSVQQLVDKNEITGVIHLAAQSRPGLCEQDTGLALAGNVTTTDNLLKACSKKKPYFLYVSTDMVFQGDRGGYKETDIPDATNVYGQTKTQAEQLVQSYEGAWCIVRPALIYGAPLAGRESSLSWTLKTLQSEEGSFFRDEIRTPVWIDNLVSLIISLAKAKATGIVHAGGPDRVSRLDFATACADVWSIPSDKIRSSLLSDDQSSNWRPKDVSLRSEIASSLIEFTDLDNALSLIKKRSLDETEIVHKAPPEGII